MNGARSTAGSSGKGHEDENFPVGSVLIAARHRPAVLAFYRVARLADDIADDPSLAPKDKLDRLGLVEASLLGQSHEIPAAVTLRAVLAERSLSPSHMLDLLEAFRRDAVKDRYADWTELMDYCRYSAAPVGRFMLDVHGESQRLWPASDALCAALQVINHLQDCAKDYREMNRIYLPLDAFAAGSLGVEALGAPAASPPLRRLIAGLATRTETLLQASAGLARATADLRIGLEIGVIQSIAEALVRRLQRHDPLSQRVHLKRAEMFGFAAAGAAGVVVRRLFNRQDSQAAA